MHLIKVEIMNFRMLHNVEVSINSETTAIVGKNNSGKTSLSNIINIFMQNRSNLIGFYDFSKMCLEEFYNSYKNYRNNKDDLDDIDEFIPKIKLKLHIKYDDEEELSYIEPFIIDLNDDNIIEILFEYSPKSNVDLIDDLSTLNDEYEKEKEKEKEEFLRDIESIYSSHYNTKYFSCNKDYRKEVDFSNINKLINATFIDAQRPLDDNTPRPRYVLSRLFQKQYEKRRYSEKSDDDTTSLDQVLKTARNNIDGKLDDFFKPFVEHFAQFGFPGLGKEVVELHIDLEPKVLFNNNIRLNYNIDGNRLPEKYNGLGYSNLIYIIANIIGFYNKVNISNNHLNILFLEEVESHMHPQMQIVFVDKLNEFLKSMDFNCQVILTTHSSHILSTVDINSIRYFLPDNDNYKTIVKDLQHFRAEDIDEASSSEEQEDRSIEERRATKNFLQQYLTLGKCDLFFADKAILLEGTVERILLPYFVSKLNNSDSENLSQQYVSVVEIGGAYFHKFKTLLEFLNLRTLIITDIDAVDSEGKKTSVERGKSQKTSNSTLKGWLPQKSCIDDLLDADSGSKISNNIKVVYQNTVKVGNISKCGRSFEEAFLLNNPGYIYKNRESLISIKNVLTEYDNPTMIIQNSYFIQDYIDRNSKKAEFAFDLLNISNESWKTPDYIREGLIWLSH